jgi:prephenate dehydrogenase
MTVKVTILGLGQIGSSIGLALAPQKEKITRVGHDTDPDITRAAKKKDVVDTVQVNLHSAVEGADLVILSVPLHEVRDILKLISADLKEGAVVLDTSPARRQGEALARELLPAGRYYVGLVPATQSGHLLETGGGLEGARADLFQGATILICTTPGLPENAVRLATDLLKLIGANPILCDSTEADGLLTGMITLPKILAVSLVDVTMDKPGWADANELAGPPTPCPWRRYLTGKLESR